MAETKAYGCGVKYADAGGEPQAKVGEAAPAFSLPDLDGKPVALADFAGKTVVLEWFNPDC
ncbi:MAG: redoxin domain-containing protein, partial [Myxococcales bacterium]|nr:redoxin domain-containing protein [Myxococcales bacterium]